MKLVLQKMKHIKMTTKFFQKILLLIIVSVNFSQTKATLPVKQCVDLGIFREIHVKMASISLQYQSELIAKKNSIYRYFSTYNSYY